MNISIFFRGEGRHFGQILLPQNVFLHHTFAGPFAGGAICWRNLWAGLRVN
jgi:hypothetical protein